MTIKKLKAQPDPSPFNALLQALTLPSQNNIPLTSKLIPLKTSEREMLKMFLWYELYSFLSRTIIKDGKEEDMFHPKTIRELLLKLNNDKEHSLEGISYSTHIPLDVIKDIYYEINTNPSTTVAAKIIEYYIISKRHEYTEFIRRVLQTLAY